MLGFEKKYPMLFEKNIIGAANMGIFTPIVVFLMDRIMITDNEFIQEESDMFKQLSNEYGGLFGFGSSNFMAELMRISNIYGNYISFSEDARMTWEAVEFVANEFDDEQKKATVDILERLATSDEYLDKKEMSIIYAVVTVCYDELDKINTVFSRFYEEIINRYRTDHQMAKALMHLMNLIAEDPKSVKLSILGRPDPKADGNIPPVLFTDDEFADWLNIVTLIRASQNRGALMIQSRVYWTIGETEDGRTLTSEKGLIKFFHISSSEDDQINESLDFTRAWCKAIRDGVGNIKMVDETIFQVVVFGEAGKMSIAPDLSMEGLWKITCKKISSGIELHAFDITGDPITYWCPDAANELAKKISVNKFWVNGSFPIDEGARNEIINKVRATFNN